MMIINWFETSCLLPPLPPEKGSNVKSGNCTLMPKYDFSSIRIRLAFKIWALYLQIKRVMAIFVHQDDEKSWFQKILKS